MPVKPQVKQRPRLGRGRRVFTPEKTLLFEAVIRDAWDGPMWETPVSLEIVLKKDSILIEVAELEVGTTPLRGDIDNYAKSIMDGLNGAAYTDDRLVRRLVITKE